jgi:inosine triphosphate pyrophosphatase
MKHIIFITENVSKYKEIENYISKIGANVSIQMIKPDFELQEIQSLDRQEIVMKKLRDAFSASNSLINLQHMLDGEKETWIMVEDTSLCIEKLGGFPGPFIKYYLQSLSLNSIANANWGSKASSYVSLAIGRYSECNQLIANAFEDCIEGLIIEPRGTNGFGYDAIFRPEESKITNAEMSMDEKEKYNPRTLAFKKVIDFLSA